MSAVLLYLSCHPVVSKSAATTCCTYNFTYIGFSIWTNQTWVWWIGFRLEPIFAAAPTALENDQKWPENNHLASLVFIRDTLCRKNMIRPDFLQTLLAANVYRCRSVGPLYPWGHALSRPQTWEGGIKGGVSTLPLYAVRVDNLIFIPGTVMSHLPSYYDTLSALAVVGKHLHIMAVLVVNLPNII